MSLVTRHISDIGVEYPVGHNPSEQQFATIHQDETDDSVSDCNYSLDDERYTSDADTDRYSINMDTDDQEEYDDENENEMEIEVEEDRTRPIVFKRLISQHKVAYASILQEEDDFLPE